MTNHYANIVIEGTNYADTKGIALALSEAPRIVGGSGYKTFTTVISTKWGNFRDFPWGANLIDFDPGENDQAMKNYGVWIRLMELQGNYNWIIDRFHISTQQYQLQHNDHLCSFNWLEERLLVLGFHLVLVTQSREALTGILENQGVVHVTGEVEKVVREQDCLSQIAAKSILPTLALDISEMDVGGAVGNIVGWLEEYGSFTPPEMVPVERLNLPTW